CPVRLVGVWLLERRGDLSLDLLLALPDVDADAELLELTLDLLGHQLNRIAVAGRQLVDVLGAVLLGRLLAAAARLDGLAESVDLAADVVVVVLALDVVAGGLEQTGDGFPGGGL